MDYPPILIDSNAFPITHILDNALFVRSSKLMHKSKAKQIVNLLKTNNVEILGSILNEMNYTKNINNILLSY